MASITLIPMISLPQHHFSTLSAKKWRRMVIVSSATAGQNPKNKLVEEMRTATMKLHGKDQAKEGEKEPAGPAFATWEPTLDGYLKFLADNKLIYEALESILNKAAFPEYEELKNTGLERSERLAKDMEWLEEEGHVIPQPSSLGTNYAQYLHELSEKDPHAFICHFYMTYFGHTAAGTGRMIGRKVEEKILKGKELEFYKYDGDLTQLLQNVRDKLNKVGERWSRDERERCLHENSFNLGGDILRLVFF